MNSQVLGCRHPLLLPPEPQAIEQPRDRDRNGDDGDAGHGQPQKAQSRIGPGAHLIAGSIDNRVDKAFGFVLVFTRHDGEQHLPGRPREGKISCAAQHLIDHQNRDGRSYGKCAETQDAQSWQHGQCKGDTDGPKDAAGKKKLRSQSEDVNPEIDAGEESGARASLGKTLTRNLQLLEVKKRRGNREEQACIRSN